jgi:hypothetical protein
MFHNQAVAAQNVSRTYGLGPVGGQPSQPMSNPFPAESISPTYGRSSWNYNPDIGARMAGGMGMALPAATTMASMGGLMMGGRAALMDPFTGVARAFRAGTGAAAGAGVQGTLGGFGAAFRTGGIRAGMGVLGGGLAAAALPAAAYYAAGKAISTVGENIYAGAQDVQQVGQMAQQYMDPAWGQAGAQRGGQRGRGQIRNMVKVLSDIAGEDTMADMESLKRIMDQAGRSGMLGGVQDVGQFKRKFKQIVDKTKEVAKAMGTSLEEALPVMSRMSQQGLWTSRDIMGTMVAGKAAGMTPDASGRTGMSYMMETSQAGAAASLGAGGSLRSGSILGRDVFRTMQAAVRSGAVSREMMAEFAPGRSGAEAQAYGAQRVMGVMQKFGQTSMGQLMLAGLGETQENRKGEQVFTGKMDPKKLEQFRRGELSVGQLQEMGQKVTQGSRESAASFMFNRERMGQEMLAEGGLETMNSALQSVLEKAMPNAGENVRKMLTQKILGISSREVEMISKLADEQGRIKDQQARENERIINEQMRRLEERQFRSWDGLKDVIGQSWDQTVQPLRDFGADLATSLGETADTLVNTITGRTKQIAMGGQERLRLFRQSMKQQATKAVAAGTETAAGTPGGAAARPAGPVNMLQMLDMTPEQRQEFMQGVGRTAEAGGARADLPAGPGVEGDQALRAITPEEAGAANVGQNWFTPGALERFTSGARIGRGGMMTGLTSLMGYSLGSRAEAVQTLGVQAEGRVGRKEDAPVGTVAGPAQAGEGYEVYSTKKIQQAMERASKRVRNPTLRNLLGKEADTDENRTRITTVQKAMRAINLDPKKKKYLQELREKGDLANYNRELAREIAKRSGGDVAEAFRGLGADLSQDPGDNQDVRDIIQIATEQGEGVSGLVLEEKQALEGLGQMSPRQLEKEQEDNLKRMQQALSGQVQEEGPLGYTGGLFGGSATKEVEGAGLSDDELTDVMSQYGGAAIDLAEKLARGEKLDEDNPLVRAAYKKDFDPAARKLVEYFQRAPASAATAFVGKVGKERGGAKEFVGLRMYRAEKESLERVRKVAKSQGEVSESLTADTRERLKDIQTTLTGVHDIKGYRAAMGDVETLAGKLKGGDIRKLARGEGGTFGRMAAAMARTDEIQAMGAKKFEDVRKRISTAIGVKDITQLMGAEDKEYLSKALEDGISKEEADELQKRFKGAITTAVGETAKDREDINKQMVSSMQAYATANTKFVQVVGDALSKMSGVEESVQESLNQMNAANVGGETK